MKLEDEIKAIEYVAENGLPRKIGESQAYICIVFPQGYIGDKGLDVFRLHTPSLMAKKVYNKAVKHVKSAVKDGRLTEYDLSVKVRDMLGL